MKAPPTAPGPAGAPAGVSPLSAEGTRVLRTVYLPNEQVDSLLLTIEALRAQLQQQERLSREHISALLEDRRLRMAEARAPRCRTASPPRSVVRRCSAARPPSVVRRCLRRAVTPLSPRRSQERTRRAAEAERMQEVEQSLARTQGMLQRYTKDYLRLKHDSLQTQRTQTEQVEALQAHVAETTAQMAELRQSAALEVHSVSTAVKTSSEQYVALYRRQVSDTERTMGLLKDQHNGLQQALAMRVKEVRRRRDLGASTPACPAPALAPRASPMKLPPLPLRLPPPSRRHPTPPARWQLEAVVGRLKQQYRELDERRGLELEGFNNEVALLQKQVGRLEMRAYGRKVRPPLTAHRPPPAAGHICPSEPLRYHPLSSRQVL